MRIWVPFAALGVLGLGLVTAGQKPATPPAAQTEKAEPGDVPTHFTFEVNRVNMLFTVSDKKGRFITDLTRNDLQVIESKREQVIAEFTSETDLPLRLAILIDTSNSIRDRFKFEQEAAISFLTGIVHPRQDKAMIVSFDTKTELASDLIDDVEKLSKAVRGLHPGGGTALFDALYFACRDKLSQDQPRYKFRRAIIIVSDGDDNDSRVSRDQALEMAQKADVVIYAISTNITRVESDGDKILKYLTSETGGRAFFPFKVEDLDQSFENIANELRCQYNVFYRPEPLKTDGLYHSVELKVKGRKDLIVRCRKGYYAPKM
jgi:Ca-activated chloride channel homolog